MSCVFCGGDKGRNKVFCSSECQSGYWEAEKLKPKKCALCDNIAVQPGDSGRRNAYCIECQRSVQRRLRGESVDRYRAYTNKHAANNRNRNRLFVYKYLEEHPCTLCGESDPLVLDFDHRHSKVAGGVCRLVARGVAIDRIKKEISKCDVLCANCHRRKTHKQFGWWRAIMQDDPERAMSYKGERIVGSLVPSVDS